MTLTDRGDEAGKMFVGGLSWETSQEKLQEYFSRFGQVVDSVVMKNNSTGNSRGFGFVTFADPASLTLVVEGGPHKLDGKVIDPKACQPRGASRGSGSGPRGGDSVPKIFLGGLSSNITEAEVREAFSQFGRVRDVNIMFDQEKRRSRGFGFLSFEMEDAVHKACAVHFVEVAGKQVECKLAVPRDSQGRRGRPPYQQQQADSWEHQPSQSWHPPAASAYVGGWGSSPMMPQASFQDGGYGDSGYQAYGGNPSYSQYGAAPQATFPSYDAQGQPSVATSDYASSDPSAAYSQGMYAAASKSYGSNPESSYGGYGMY